MGRSLNKTAMYEGQFAKDKMHGYGRLIAVKVESGGETSDI